MTFEVNGFKVLRMFAPIWLLVGLSLWLNWDDWLSKPLLLAAVGGLPIWAALAAMALGRRWRLELTKDALVHHALFRTERFEWARMGPVQSRATTRLTMFLRTLWFAFPLDEPRDLEERATKLTGRRILSIFGDGSSAGIIKQIEDWRALYTARSGQP